MAIVYVHGGVSGVEREEPVSPAAAVPGASECATALDAVEAAIVALEDDPRFNAGWGAALDRDGDLALDAGLADGATGHQGAVAAVGVRNPIVLARRVLEDTPHVLLAGAGAMALAPDLAKLADTTPEQRERWQRARDRGDLDPEDYGRPDQVDTVGAVALDDDGHLAAGSSTGGVLGKLPGRVGDAPIFGAGFYASSDAAVVGTGVGELFIATLASFRAARLIEEGAEPQAACESVIEHLAHLKDTAAGLLALDRRGRIGAAFTGGSLVVAGPDGIVEPVRLNRSAPAAGG